MKRNCIFYSIAVMTLLAILGLSSCCHKEPMSVQLLGHWGCERYISCRELDNGSQRWDTLNYVVGEGHGYELWFREDGSGKMRMNDSPLLIKEVSCTYELDEDLKEILIRGSGLIFLIYGSLYLDENEIRFNINTLNDTVLDVSWINNVSESKPYYENFYLKKITN